MQTDCPAEKRVRAINRLRTARQLLLEEGTQAFCQRGGFLQVVHHLQGHGLVLLHIVRQHPGVNPKSRGGWLVPGRQTHRAMCKPEGRHLGVVIMIGIGQEGTGAAVSPRASTRDRVAYRWSEWGSSTGCGVTMTSGLCNGHQFPEITQLAVPAGCTMGIAGEPDTIVTAGKTGVPHRGGEGWLYLAVVIDLYSRRVVNWAMSSSRMKASLATEALLMAYWRGETGKGD